MNPVTLASLIGTHDPKQWAIFYVASVAGLLAGLLVSRAWTARRWSAPLIAIPVTVISAVLTTTIGKSISHLLPGPHAQGLALTGPLLSVAIGLLVGLAGARRRGDHAVKRGTVIIDPPRNTRPRRGTP